MRQPLSIYVNKMRFFKILMCLCLSACVSANVKSFDVPDLSNVKGKSGYEKARTLVKTGEVSCVLLKEDEIIAVNRGAGILPLLALYDAEPQKMETALLVDKVIGRATAMIALNGKVGAVHAGVMSEDALELLEEKGVSATYDKLVPKILNRQGNGLCPMEKAVQKITVPQEAVSVLREELQKMKGKK